MLAQLTLLSLAAAQASADPPDQRLELPDGPAAKVWAQVATDTPPHPMDEKLLALATRGSWSRPSTWAHWCELLRAEAEGASDPARRAQLCLLARAQGRTRDAWSHYHKLGADPRWAAAVTPLLIPGVPAQTPIGPGGVCSALPDGVQLEPFLPPPSAEASPGKIEWRSASVQGLPVGEARVDFSVTIEATGVQVDLTHVSGPAVTVHVRMPEPEGVQIRIEYLDWEQVETLRQPIPVHLRPGEEKRTLWGRFLEERFELPTGRARRVPTQIEAGGLFLVLPEDDRSRPALELVAASLAELIGVRVELSSPAAPQPTWTGTTLDLTDRSERSARLRYLASALEAHLLADD